MVSMIWERMPVSENLHTISNRMDQVYLELWHFCDTFPALSWGNFNTASGMLQTRLIHNHKYFKKGA